MVKLILYKNSKIGQAWWQKPVIPATREAETELLEPGRQSLPRAKIAPLHSSLGNRTRFYLRKKKKIKSVVHLYRTFTMNGACRNGSCSG